MAGAKRSRFAASARMPCIGRCASELFLYRHAQPSYDKRWLHLDGFLVSLCDSLCRHSSPKLAKQLPAMELARMVGHNRLRRLSLSFILSGSLQPYILVIACGHHGQSFTPLNDTVGSACHPSFLSSDLAVL